MVKYILIFANDVVLCICCCCNSPWVYVYRIRVITICAFFFFQNDYIWGAFNSNFWASLCILFKRIAPERTFPQKWALSVSSNFNNVRSQFKMRSVMIWIQYSHTLWVRQKYLPSFLFFKKWESSFKVYQFHQKLK